MKSASCIHTGGTTISTTDLKHPALPGVLVVTLLAGAGDHQIRMGKRQFLCIDAPD